METKERLRKARAFLKLTQEALAIETGSQRTTVAGYENGISLPRPEFLMVLSIKYRINPNWILTGQGNMLNEDVEPQKSLLEQGLDETIAAHPIFTDIESRLAALETLLKKEPAAAEEASEAAPPLYLAETAPAYGWEEEEARRGRIAYVNSIAAGPPITIDGEADHAVLVPEYLLRRGEEYYAATVRGSSMTERGIRDGDLVLIRVTNVPRSGAVQAVRYQDKVTLKLVRQTESGGWELRYKDGTKQVIACDTDEYEVLGEFEAVLPEDTPVVRI